jgi:hypothetical protein
MTIVHINIRGRCGNQLFQYWAGKFIASQLNRKFNIYIDEDNFLREDLYPNLNLPEFKIFNLF